MRKKILLLLLLFCVRGSAAQTTTANFDTPKCSGNGVGIYQGINFSASPWDCEIAGIPGDATTTISWYQNNKTGTFKFVSPAILTSITLGASKSGSGGTFTISTDAGDSLTKAVASNTLANVTTGFTKAASVVTVGFTGGWTLELDNITYQTAVVTPPPPTITGVSVSCVPSSITPTQTSVCAATVTGTGAFSKTVSWTSSDGSMSSSGVLTPSGNAASASVIATSTQDTTKSGAATVSITLPPPPPTCAGVTVTINGANFASGVTATIAGLPLTVTGATSTTITGTLPCTAVTLSNPIVSPTAHSAALSWTASTSSVAGYRVYRTVTSGSNYGAPLAPTLLTVTTYTDTTVSAGATYFYVTTAVDGNGNESSFSNEVSAAIPNP